MYVYKYTCIFAYRLPRKQCTRVDDWSALFRTTSFPERGAHPVPTRSQGNCGGSQYLQAHRTRPFARTEQLPVQRRVRNGVERRASVVHRLRVWNVQGGAGLGERLHTVRGSPASLDLGCGLGLGFLCVPGGIEELVMGVHSTGV
jgi:hypothetical protein